MAHFESLVQQKSLLREKLLSNQNIVNLLLNVGNNVNEFTDYPLGSKSPAASLIKPHFYVPGTTTVDKNFIVMKGRILYANTDVVKRTALIVYVLCNDDQIDLMQGSRADLLANEIDMILNNGEEPLFGYGGIDIGQAEELRFIDGYSGWEIPFTTHEINRKAELI